MSSVNPATALAGVVVDELARGGVRHVVASPGSRSTALLLACEANPELELTMQLDERSAAFRTLGISLASGRPAAVLTTSGSAVANLLPAVVEADRAMVPLIVISADRPDEFVARRANQTMNQRDLFTPFVRFHRHITAPTVDVDGNASWREAVALAIVAASGGDLEPGPVHLNVSFREPTIPVGDDGRSRSAPYPFDLAGAPAGRPWRDATPHRFESDVGIPDLGDRVVVAVGHGGFDRDDLESALYSAEVVVLATSRSGLRHGSLVRNHHHLLVDGFPDGLQPTGVVVVGDLNPADRIFAAIRPRTPVVFVDRRGVFTDPSGVMTSGFRGEAGVVLARVGPQSADWSQSWSDAGMKVRSTVDEYLDGLGEMSGPAVARTLNEIEWDSLVVGSSLAARDVDSQLDRAGSVYSNRGVSGIDGFVSTALGIASVGGQTLAYVGDLSFLHDSNGFLGEDLPPVCFVVFDNNGGGLFDLLPQARLVPAFERLFVTPQNRDFGLLAEFHHLHYSLAHTPTGLLDSVASAFRGSTPSLIHVPVDRSFDLRVRNEIDRLSSEAVTRL